MVNIDGLIKNADYKYLDFVLDSNSIIKNKLGYTIYSKAVIFATNENGGYSSHCIGVWKTSSEYDTTTGKIATIDAFNNNIERKEFPLTTNIKKRKEKVIYLGSFSGIWGHTITDSIRCLWFLNSEYYKGYKDYKLVYTTWGNFKPINNYAEFFKMLGINFACLEEIKEPTLFDEIIVPQPSFVKVGFTQKRLASEEYKSTIQSITENFKLCNYSPKMKYSDKIYFSSRKSAKERFVGEEKIEKYLKKIGFTIVYPEKISFYEQLYVLTHCIFFVSTDGSCSHNSVFTNDDATIVIIPRGEYLTTNQAAINHIKQQHIFYIESCLSFLCNKDGYIGPFYFYFSKNMMSFFSINQEEKKWIKTNFKDAKRYFKRGLYESYDNEFSGNSYVNDFLHYYSKYLELKKIKYFLYRIFRKIRFSIGSR